MNWDDFFNNETITALISVLLTFVTTRRIFNPPQNTEIFEESLSNAYLPLIKIFSQCEHKYWDADKIEFLNNAQNQDTIKEILSNYYVYLSPEIPEKVYNLFEDVKYGLFSLENFNKIYYLINEDYERIKKYLGYPSMSSSSKFIRTNFGGKMRIFGTILKKMLIITLCFFLVFTLALFIIAGETSIKNIFIFFIIISIIIFTFCIIDKFF
ncbi:MAG: hypothetical protein Q4D26_11490 [Clostridia bacterium]|nr:hypothetical protein [Clostridia bacterium]